MPKRPVNWLTVTYLKVPVNWRDTVTKIVYTGLCIPL